MRVDQNLVSELQLVSEVRPIDKYAPLLRVPSQVQLLIASEKAIVEPLYVIGLVVVHTLCLLDHVLDSGHTVSESRLTLEV